MARLFLIVMAIAFFVVCFSQAAPAQEASSTNKIQEDLTKLYESFKQSIESISQDPKVQDIIKQGQEFAQRVQQEASKLIPKTDGTAAA